MLYIDVMLCTIWYHLYNLKNVKKTHGGVLLLVKASAYNFTKNNTLAWVFFTFLKLCKYYQIVEKVIDVCKIRCKYSNSLKYGIVNLKGVVDLDFSNLSVNIKPPRKVSLLAIAPTQARPRWLGHVEKMDKENLLINCRFIEIGSQRGKGRPCKTWTQIINDGLRKLRLQSGLTRYWLA